MNDYPVVGEVSNMGATMNFLFPYKSRKIIEIRSEEDITEEFEKHCGCKAKDQLFLVDLLYESKNHTIEHEKKLFWKDELKEAKENGFFWER